MNVFIRAVVRIFSFSERWNVLFNSAVASLNRTFHLSSHENSLTIARIKTFIICVIRNTYNVALISLYLYLYIYGIN